MPRRVSLPAADELFRTTGGSAVQPSGTPQHQANGESVPGERIPGPATASEGESSGPSAEPEGSAHGHDEPATEGEEEHASTASTEASTGGGSGSTSGPAGDGAPSGRAQQAAGAVNGERPARGQRKAEVPAEPGERATVPGQGGGRRSAQSAAQQAAARAGQPAGQSKSRQAAGDSARGRRATQRRPSGRERHDEKITVYVSAEELMDLEHARLVLRGEHGLAVDRGRIVREAVAVVLADLESRGDASILVRRLRGR